MWERASLQPLDEDDSDGEKDQSMKTGTTGTRRVTVSEPDSDFPDVTSGTEPEAKRQKEFLQIITGFSDEELKILEEVRRECGAQNKTSKT